MNHSNSTGKILLFNKETIRQNKMYRKVWFFTEKMLGRLKLKENYHDMDKKEELQRHITVTIAGIFRNLKKSCDVDK